MSKLFDRNNLKYQQVKVSIESVVDQLQPGDKIPSERDLAKHYDCNFLTVRKALALLVEEGRIEKRTGSGTFVTDPNAIAKNANHVGVLLHTFSDPYALRITGCISQTATDRKITLHTKMIQDYQDSAMHAVQSLENEGCCAVIVPWFPWEQTQQMLQFVGNSPIPVSIPAVFPGLENQCFARAATFGKSATHYTDLSGKYFRKLGYNNIAFIGPLSVDNDILHRKIIGYTNFIGQAGLDNLCQLIGPDTKAMDKIANKLKQFKGDLAVISYDDQHAMRFLTAMHKLGLQAPQDFGILGYNNTDAAEHADPPLSCLYGDYVHPAQAMLENALGLAQGKVVQATYCRPLYFKLRDSCSGKLRMGDKLPQLLEEIGFTDMPDEQPVEAI
ncbi:MAG: substrate-binding domain-containing protein [Phycisphaeraceae bacterium JB051]